MQAYYKFTRAYSLALITPFYLLVLGVGIVGYTISFTADQTPKYERVCFTSHAYDLNETFGNFYWNCAVWGGAISMALFLTILVLLAVRAQVWL